MLSALEPRLANLQPEWRRRANPRTIPSHGLGIARGFAQQRHSGWRFARRGSSAESKSPRLRFCVLQCGPQSSRSNTADVAVANAVAVDENGFVYSAGLRRYQTRSPGSLRSVRAISPPHAEGFRPYARWNIFPPESYASSMLEVVAFHASGATSSERHGFGDLLDIPCFDQDGGCTRRFHSHTKSRSVPPT